MDLGRRRRRRREYTNLIALKLIFEPIEPTRIGPFMVQGMFLRRQHEVSAEFADCMTEKLLASETLWDGILTGPGAGKFRELLEARTAAFMGGAAAVLYGGDHPTEFAGGWWRQLERRVSGRVMELLPTELPLIHGYVDDTLGLRETLKVNLRKLSPAEFEQVLHPVFQEDELTLVLVGAVLGLAVGYAQCVWDARDKRLAREAAEAGPAPPETYIGAAAAAAAAKSAGGLAHRRLAAVAQSAPPRRAPPPPAAAAGRALATPVAGDGRRRARPPPPSPPPSPTVATAAGAPAPAGADARARPPSRRRRSRRPLRSRRTIRRRRRASAGCAPASPRARCAGCAATPSPRRRMASSGAERFDRRMFIYVIVRHVSRPGGAALWRDPYVHRVLEEFATIRAGLRMHPLGARPSKPSLRVLTCLEPRATARRDGSPSCARRARARLVARGMKRLAEATMAASRRDGEMSRS